MQGIRPASVIKVWALSAVNPRRDRVQHRYLEASALQVVRRADANDTGADDDDLARHLSLVSLACTPLEELGR